MTDMANIKRGRLTDFEKAEIERLAGEMTKPTPSKIARRLNRHPGTVNWHMITTGLIERKLKYPDRPIVRRKSGREVHPFTARQDARLIELRLAGKTYREIADALVLEFGIRRTGHTTQVRHKMLSAYEGGPEDVVEIAA